MGDSDGKENLVGANVGIPSSDLVPSLNDMVRTKVSLSNGEPQIPSLDDVLRPRENSVSLIEVIGQYARPVEESLWMQAIKLDLALDISRGLFAPRKKDVPDLSHDESGEREYQYLLSYGRDKKGKNWEFTPSRYRQFLTKGHSDDNFSFGNLPGLDIKFDEGKITSVGLNWYLKGSANSLGIPGNEGNYHITGLEERPTLKHILDLPEFSEPVWGGWHKIELKLNDRVGPRLVLTNSSSASHATVPIAEYTFDPSNNSFSATEVGLGTTPEYGATLDEKQAQKLRELTISAKEYEKLLADMLSFVPV